MRADERRAKCHHERAAQTEDNPFTLLSLRRGRHALIPGELGQDPADLPPRDRQKYWYAAIAHAGLDTPEARAAGDRLVEPLGKVGYVVGPAPGATPPPPPGP